MWVLQHYPAIPQKLLATVLAKEHNLGKSLNFSLLFAFWEHTLA